MIILIVTVDGDPQAAASPLATARADGLLDALTDLGHLVVARRVPVPPDPVPALRVAADAGRLLPDADVVLCDGPLSAVAAYDVHRRTGAPVVLWAGAPPRPHHPTADRLETDRLVAAVLRSAALVLATCDVTAAHLQARGATGPVGLVPPAVDVRVYAEPSWIQTRAGQDDAPLTIRTAGPDARAAAAGLARALPGIVVEPAPDDDGPALRRALHTADVVVTGLSTPTAQDGGRATLRAMACARPVVALDVPPDGDLVLHEVSGLVVRRPGDLAATAGALARDPFRGEALGQGALERVLVAHTPAAVAAQLDAALDVLALVPANARRAVARRDSVPR